MDPLPFLYEHAPTEHAFFVHTVWLRIGHPAARAPPHLTAFAATWKQHHTEGDIVHLHWTQPAVDALLAEYPQYSGIVATLMHEVQRCDLVRLLILHRLGGLYADMDVECRARILPRWRDAPKPILLVRSPLFCEVFTNCLMIARCSGHPFWLSVADEIVHSVCGFEDGSGLSRPVRHALCIPGARTFVRTMFISTLTGPGCVDRTISTDPQRWGAVVGVLSSKEGYWGAAVRHHEAAMWFPARVVHHVMAAAAAVALAALLWHI